MSVWHIIRTVGARERVVAAELKRGLGLHSYHPVERFKLTRADRTIERQRPLMPCYLFVLGIEPGVWHDVKATKGVIGWATFAGSDRPAYVTDIELSRIRDIEHAFNLAKDDRRQARALCVGDRVRINKGPFADMETLLTAIKGNSVEFRGPWGKGTVAAASVSLVA